MAGLATQGEGGAADVSEVEGEAADLQMLNRDFTKAFARRESGDFAGERRLY